MKDNGHQKLKVIDHYRALCNLHIYVYSKSYKSWFFLTDILKMLIELRGKLSLWNLLLEICMLKIFISFTYMDLITALQLQQEQTCI